MRQAVVWFEREYLQKNDKFECSEIKGYKPSILCTGTLVPAGVLTPQSFQR